MFSDASVDHNVSFFRAREPAKQAPSEEKVAIMIDISLMLVAYLFCCEDGGYKFLRNLTD
jgi:hypothetical protein